MKRIVLAVAIVLAASCASPKAPESKPLVGISCSRTASNGTSLAATYTKSIEMAGGIAVVLPTIDSEEAAADLVGALDGIIFSGGADINPSEYGETVFNETVHVDTLRDVSDLLLAKAAIASGKPILGICRGEQLMNVALGGTLYQDIPSQVGKEIFHGGGPLHKIAVEKGSFLYEIYKTDTLTVNSFHHQCVKDLAPGLKVAAKAPDGVVEAYEGKNVIAVQFHPEKMLYAGDETWLPLFRYYLEKL